MNSREMVNKSPDRNYQKKFMKCQVCVCSEAFQNILILIVFNCGGQNVSSLKYF